MDADDSGLGAAISIKIPVAFTLASIDAYRMALNEERWSAGYGLEMGAMPAAYLVATRHVPEWKWYGTLTARVLIRIDDPIPYVAPQLTIGQDGPSGASLFVMYARHLGRGWTFDPSVTGPRPIHVPQALAMGVALRF